MPVRIGFVGAGGIAGAHFNNLEQIKDAQPVAFSDLDRDRVEAAARRFDGKAYTNPLKMLEDETLDAIYVCVPPHAHKNFEILAAQKGCALFIEKPVSNKVGAAEKVAQAIEDAGVLSSVGYHFRYFEATERAQKLLAQKSSSDVALAYGRWLGGFPGPAWWRNLEQSGGQLNEQATHIVDLARYLIGEISEVYCVSALREMHKHFENSTVPDVTALTVKFDSGAVGHFSTASLFNGFDEVGLDLAIHEQMLQLRGNTLKVLGGGKGETAEYSHANNPYFDEDEAFVKAVQSGKRTLIKSTYADALKTLRVTLAANKSMKTGRPVKP